MELKLITVERERGLIASLNRTFMELKRNFAEERKPALLVLIEPLWN